MNTKLWLEELLFGYNFGNLRAIGSSRFWCYFLVHTFQIKKLWIDFTKRFPKYSKVVKNFIRLQLRKFLCVRIEIRCFDSQYTAFKPKKPHSIIFTRCWVLVYVTFAHGRTDWRKGRHFWNSFIFSSWSRIYIHVHTFHDYFSNFTPFWPKLVYLFFHLGNRYEFTKITEVFRMLPI